METTFYNYGAVVIFLASLLVNIVFFLVIMIRYRSTKVKSLQLLLLTSIIAIIVEIMSIYLSLTNINNVMSHYISTGSLFFNLFGILTAGTFLIFIDYFESSSFKSKNILFFISTLLLNLSYVLIIQSFPSEILSNVNPSFELFFSIYLAISSLMLPVFLFYVIIASIHSIQIVKRYAFNENQIKQLNLMILVIIFYFLITLVSNFASNVLYGPFLNEENIVLQFTLTFLIPKSSTIIGSIILLLAYMRNKSVAFLQPQRILQLLVINSVRLPVYSFKFRDQKTDSMLFSGGMTAINSMLKETIGLSSEIELIRFTDLDIMVSRDNDIGVFILVEKSSKFIKEALKNFLELFTGRYGSEIQESVVDVNAYISADELVKNAFGLS